MKKPILFYAIIFATVLGIPLSVTADKVIIPPDKSKSVLTFSTDPFSDAEIKSLALFKNLNLLSLTDGPIKQDQLDLLFKTLEPLQNFESLNLSKNKLTTIPTSIKNLIKLKTLNLSNNKMQLIFPALTALNPKVYIDLSGNPLDMRQFLNLLEAVKKNEKRPQALNASIIALQSNVYTHAPAFAQSIIKHLIQKDYKPAFGAMQQLVTRIKSPKTMKGLGRILGILSLLIKKEKTDFYPQSLRLANIGVARQREPSLVKASVDTFQQLVDKGYKPAFQPAANAATDFFTRNKSIIDSLKKQKKYDVLLEAIEKHETEYNKPMYDALRGIEVYRKWLSKLKQEVIGADNNKSVAEYYITRTHGIE